MSCELPRFSSYSRTLVRWHAVTHLWPTILACPLACWSLRAHWRAHSRLQLSVSLCPYLLVSARAARSPLRGIPHSTCAHRRRQRPLPIGLRHSRQAPPVPPVALSHRFRRAAARSLDPARARAFLGEQSTTTLRKPSGAAYALAVRSGACCLVVQPPPLWKELAVFWLSLLRTAQARREPLSDGARPPTLSVPGSWAA